VNLTKKVFVYDKEPRSPSENLAINRHVVGSIENGKFDLITRVYHHTLGVILGYHESARDVDEVFCEKYGYEIVRRPTGGSAIVVDPTSSICYSVIFDLDKTGKEKDITKIYKEITIPLAKNLGKGTVVEGTYYLRSRINGENIPFAGHALKLYGNIVQFDGVINRTRMDMGVMEGVLNLRKLHGLNGENYVSVNGSAYNLEGKKVDVDLSGAEILRDEALELRKMHGLRQLGLDDESFIHALYSTVGEVFDDVERIGALEFDNEVVEAFRKEILDQSRGGKQTGLGHCFVDLVEPEPKITHYG
jgi:hypothetical protein